MIEAPLHLRINDFENRHDSVMSYVFDVLVSCQKQFFSDMSTNLSPYPMNVPTERAPAVPFILNHGVRTDIDEAKAAIARQKEQEKQLASQPYMTPQQPQPNPQYNQHASGDYGYLQQGYSQQSNSIYQNPGQQGYYQENQTNYYQPPQNPYYQQNNYYQTPEASQPMNQSPMVQQPMDQPPMSQPPMPQPPMDQPPMPQPPMPQPPMDRPPMDSPSIYSSEERREPVYSQPQPEM